MKIPIRRWLSPVYRDSIYVMRHGRTVLDDEKRSDGWLDYPLSDSGRVGLLTAQQYLKTSPLRKIYAPSLQRTAETAHILQSGILTRPEVIIDDHPRSWHLGILIGTKKKPNKPLVKYYMDHPNEKPDGGESMAEFHARFIPWVEQKAHEVKEGGGPILIVTSGSNLRELSNHLTGNVATFDLDEGGLMVLRCSGEKMEGQVIMGHKHGEDEGWS